MSNKGFLAIWCDIGEEDFEDYRNWIIKEHIADRTFLPGFHGARFCESIDDRKSHFFLYATESKKVFTEAPYLKVLNAPSPWTQRIMPKFGQFDRALGEQVLKIGNGFGPFMMVCRVKDPSTLRMEVVRENLAPFMDLKDVVSVRWMTLDRSSTDLRSQEKTMRTGVEGDFHHLLVVEAISESGAVQARKAWPSICAGAFPRAEKSDASVRRVVYSEAPHEGPTA